MEGGSDHHEPISAGLSLEVFGRLVHPPDIVDAGQRGSPPSLHEHLEIGVDRGDGADSVCE
jgi:hypothetical protein